MLRPRIDDADRKFGESGCAESGTAPAYRRTKEVFMHKVFWLVPLAAACGEPTPKGPVNAQAAINATPGADAKPTRPGCNPTLGVHCDGDWREQCHPACGIQQCCSPRDGAFRCVAPGPDGYCPAPDIFVDTSKISGQTTVEWRIFEPDDCAIVEGCVAAAGRRRLLRFDTFTPNTGSADLFLGDPASMSSLFEWSACHMHYHFTSYATYELRRSDGTVAARGHKQSFCLEDSSTFPNPDDSAEGFYTCEYQGIQRGWGDMYDRDLDCQWIDITDVPAGQYSLRIALNTAHLLAESNYDNNLSTVMVSVPAGQ
jgi:hypothetical protein